MASASFPCLFCRLGANVGRAATGAARGAARFVSTPLRVAQKNYAVIGKQAFLTSAGVLQANEGKPASDALDLV